MHHLDESTLATKRRDSASKFQLFVFKFALVDIFFLPYFWLISIPLSFPFVIYWCLKNASYIFSGKDGFLFKIIFVTIIVGLQIGMVFYPEYSYDNFKLTGLFLYCFGIYFLFKKTLPFYNLNFLNILRGFYLFLAFMLLIYYFNRNLYEVTSTFWNFRSGGAIAGLYEDLVGYRFSFIWTDPNNIAYMIVAIYIFTISYFRIRIIENFLLFSLTVITLLASASRGGAIAFVVSISLYIFLKFLTTLADRRQFGIRLRDLVAAQGILLLAILLWSISDSTWIEKIMSNEVISYAQERLQDSDDTRLAKWKSYYDEIEGPDLLFYILAGRGAGSIFNGKSVSPHNGHLFWIFNYGLTSLIALLLFLFKPMQRMGVMNRLWMVPFFLGFTVNIMIGESKLFSIYLLMLAYSLYRQNRKL